MIFGIFRCSGIYVFKNYIFNLLLFVLYIWCLWCWFKLLLVSNFFDIYSFCFFKLILIKGFMGLMVLYSSFFFIEVVFIGKLGI